MQLGDKGIHFGLKASKPRGDHNLGIQAYTLNQLGPTTKSFQHKYHGPH